VFVTIQLIISEPVCVMTEIRGLTYMALLCEWFF